MIHSRLVEHLKKQHWTGALIELVIVILGVFIGLQANNWNTQRHDAVVTAQYLRDFDASLGRTETWLKGRIDFYNELKKNGVIALSLINKQTLTAHEKATLYDALRKMQFIFPIDPENLDNYVDKVDQGSIQLNNHHLKQAIAEFGNTWSAGKAITSQMNQRLNSYLSITDHYNAVGPALPDGRPTGLFDRADARKDPSFRIALAGELNIVRYRTGNFEFLLGKVIALRKRLKQASK